MSKIKPLVKIALLFLAGVTSSLSMLQPAIAFFEEGFHMNRRTSVTFLCLLTFLGANAVVLTPGLTVLATMDGYASDLGIPLLALSELFLFIFVVISYITYNICRL